jgi:hypothetical protein
MTKAEWAVNLLSSNHFKDVLTELKDIEVNKIIASDIEDIGTREDAYIMISAYNQIYASIESMAADKKIIAGRWKIF